MEQEEIKKKLEDIKDKSIQVFNAESKEKAMKFVDRLFGWIQRASCVFAVLLICLFAVVLVYSALYAMFHSADTKLAPDYKEYSQKHPIKVEKKVDESSVEINKEFGDELIEICKLSGQEKPDQLVSQISAGIEKKHRKAFIKGMLTFLKDAKASIGNDYKPEEHGAVLLDVYGKGFMKGIEELPDREAKAKMECEAAWSRALTTLYGILIVMVLIMLIKIERNTRKED